MVFYLDSSSVVKLYFQEAGSEAVRVLGKQVANVFTTSRVTYVEVRPALARRRREGRFDSEAEYRSAIRDLNRDWRRFFVKLALTERNVRLAGELAEQHALRGYDAVHLASVLLLQQRIGAQLSLSTWDSDLSQAASVAGVPLVHHEATP